MALFITLLVVLSIAGFIGWVNYDPKNPWITKKDVDSITDFLLGMPGSSAKSATTADYDLGYAYGVMAAKSGVRPETISDQQIANLLVQGPYKELAELDQEMEKDRFEIPGLGCYPVQVGPWDCNPIYFADYDERI